MASDGEEVDLLMNAFNLKLPDMKVSYLFLSSVRQEARGVDTS